MLKGEYSINYTFNNMFINYTICLTRNNIITRKGLNYLLNRLCYGVGEDINRLSLGNGEGIIDYTDTGLIHLTQTKNVITDIRNNMIIYNAYFSTTEANGSTEIGLYSDELLITHDSFNKINLPDKGLVHINYKLIFGNNSCIHEWLPFNPDGNIFYTRIGCIVDEVFDESMNKFLVNVDSLEGMCVYSFYQDRSNNRLYICLDDNRIYEHIIKVTYDGDVLI